MTADGKGGSYNLFLFLFFVSFLLILLPSDIWHYICLIILYLFHSVVFLSDYIFYYVNPIFFNIFVIFVSPSSLSYFRIHPLPPFQEREHVVQSEVPSQIKLLFVYGVLIQTCSSLPVFLLLNLIGRAVTTSIQSKISENQRGSRQLEVNPHGKNATIVI